MERNVDANGEFTNASIITAAAFTNRAAMPSTVVQVEVGTSNDSDILNMKVYINQARLDSTQVETLSETNGKF